MLAGQGNIGLRSIEITSLDDGSLSVAQGFLFSAEHMAFKYLRSNMNEKGEVTFRPEASLEGSNANIDYLSISNGSFEGKSQLSKIHVGNRQTGLDFAYECKNVDQTTSDARVSDRKEKVVQSESLLQPEEALTGSFAGSAR
jgi:hypothetical protein